MILYNSDFKLVGMSKSTLHLLGFFDFGVFYSNHKDISDFFIEEDINLETYNHFIEYMLKNKKDSINIKTKIDNSKIVNLELSLDNFYNIDRDICYIINIKQVEEKKPILKSTIELDENWLKNKAKNIELNVNDYKDIVLDLIDKAKSKEKILQESLVLGDKKQSSYILLSLKEPATSLGIEQLVDAISELENSNLDEISVKFAKYKNVIKKLNKIIIQRDEI